MAISTIHGSCLCGAVRWECDGVTGSDAAARKKMSELEQLFIMAHCHCSRCRKTHGAPYATFVSTAEGNFRLTRGKDEIVRWESKPGTQRCFCRNCGSVVPDGVAHHGQVFMPAGNFDEDPGVRPTAHLFTGSKAPWFEIKDDVPQFETAPAGSGLEPLPKRRPADPFSGSPRGSCLCGQVAYMVEETPLRSRYCHCARCRKAASAANVAYLVTPLEGVRFTRGESLVSTFKVPDAKHFKHAFCRVCGSSMPREDADREIVIIPMGSLDDEPPIRPQSRIWVGSKASWDVVDDALPAHPEAAPGG